MDLTQIEIDGSMPVKRFLNALATEGLTLKHNTETGKLRVVESSTLRGSPVASTHDIGRKRSRFIHMGDSHR